MVVSIAALMSACAPAQRSGIEVGEVFALSSTDRPPLVGSCGNPDRDSWRVLAVVAERQPVPWWASQSLFMSNTAVGFQSEEDPDVRVTGVNVVGNDLNWVRSRKTISEGPGTIVALFCCPVQFYEETVESGITAENRELHPSTSLRFFVESQGGLRSLTDISPNATSVGQLSEQCAASGEAERTP